MRKKMSIIYVPLLLFLFNFALLTNAKAFLIKEGEMKGIAYMAGGVGINERSVMEKKEGPYNLKMVFAEASGLYLADIEVTIYDANQKKIFQVVSNGPWLYVALPPGEYQISAVHNHKTKHRKIKVGNYLKRTMFHWRS